MDSPPERRQLNLYNHRNQTSNLQTRGKPCLNSLEPNRSQDHRAFELRSRKHLHELPNGDTLRRRHRLGGLVALVHEGDSITLDANKRLLTLNVTEPKIASQPTDY